MATILVIDDHKAIRALLRAVLEDAGHEVLEASNGRLGLECYWERSADLIIMDMLDMNDLDMMVVLTKNFINAKVIAMCGGLDGKTVLDMATHLGAWQTLQKPFDMEELLSAVRYDLVH